MTPRDMAVFGAFVPWPPVNYLRTPSDRCSESRLKRGTVLLQQHPRHFDGLVSTLSGYPCPSPVPGSLDRALAGLSIRTRCQPARPVLASQGETWPRF